MVSTTATTTSRPTRIAGAATLLALLLATTACGTATAPATDLTQPAEPAGEARIYPPIEKPVPAADPGRHPEGREPVPGKRIPDW